MQHRPVSSAVGLVPSEGWIVLLCMLDEADLQLVFLLKQSKPCCSRLGTIATAQSTAQQGLAGVAHSTP